MRVKLEKIRRYFQEKRKPLVLTLLPFSLFSLVFLLTPRFMLAAPSVGDVFSYTPLGILTNVTKDAIGEHLAGVYLAMAESMFKGGIWAVNAAISFTSSFINSSNIFPAWQKVRDLSLSLFGIAVLAIAFMNLLRLQIQVWGVNRMIPKLLLGIFLVIFSKFICISIINFATALANTFKNELTSFDTFNKLLDNSGLSIFFNGPGDISLPAIVGVFWFSAIAFLVFLLLAIILFFRAVVLGLLIVVSPLAFALTVLPWTQKYFQEWWKMFLKWTFFFPVCILILGVGFSLIPGKGTQPKDPNSVNGSTPLTDIDMEMGMEKGIIYYCKDAVPNEPLKPPGCVPKYPLRDKEAETSSADEFFAMMVSMFVALVAVVLSVFLPLKMLGAFGAVAQDVLSGKKGIPGLNKGRRALINPATYRRMWDARGERKKAETRADIDQKMRKMSKGFDKIPKVGDAVGSWATGFNKQAMSEYMEKESENIKKGIGNPKALGAYFQYLAAKQAGDNTGAGFAKQSFDNLATAQEKSFAGWKEKELGGGQNALDAFAVSYSKTGKGAPSTFVNPHTTKALERIGAMKNGVLAAPELRSQNPWMSGKDAIDLGAADFKNVHHDYWQFATPEHLADVSTELVHLWKKESGATGKQFAKAADAFDRADMAQQADILKR